MKALERAKMVSAMEFIARQINDEGVFEGWLISGVADGDIPYGTLGDPDDLECYLGDEDFAELMELFLRLMRRAGKDGLYCDGVVSK